MLKFNVVEKGRSSFFLQLRVFVSDPWLVGMKPSAYLNGSGCPDDLDEKACI